MGWWRVEDGRWRPAGAGTRHPSLVSFLFSTMQGVYLGESYRATDDIGGLRARNYIKLKTLIQVGREEWWWWRGLDGAVASSACGVPPTAQEVVARACRALPSAHPRPPFATVCGRRQRRPRVQRQRVHHRHPLCGGDQRRRPLQRFRCGGWRERERWARGPAPTPPFAHFLKQSTGASPWRSRPTTSSTPSTTVFGS